MHRGMRGWLDLIREYGWTRLLGLGLLAGCVTAQRAPVVDRVPLPPPATTAVSKPMPPKSAGDVPKATPSLPTAIPSSTKPATHTIQKGETLYGIARQYGLDYRELGAWNNVPNANSLRESMVLQLTAPATRAGQPGVTALPISIDVAPEGKPSADSVTMPPAPAQNSDDKTVDIKTEPKASRLPYSDVALAKIQRGEPDNAGRTAKPEAKAYPKPDGNPGVKSDNESLQWVWPTNGRITSSFNESSKGFDIAGVLGQPIFASADGRVSYIGNSLRGYGKMIVIIHNKSHLSLYAHNSAILVKEGQTVTRGQKIAEMGNSDSDDGAVKLHFEIRRLGKPVDPWKYLPSERLS